MPFFLYSIMGNLGIFTFGAIIGLVGGALIFTSTGRSLGKATVSAGARGVARQIEKGTQKLESKYR